MCSEMFENQVIKQWWTIVLPSPNPFFYVIDLGNLLNTWGAKLFEWFEGINVALVMFIRYFKIERPLNHLPIVKRFEA